MVVCLLAEVPRVKHRSFVLEEKCVLLTIVPSLRPFSLFTKAWSFGGSLAVWYIAALSRQRTHMTANTQTPGMEHFFDVSQTLWETLLGVNPVREHWLVCWPACPQDPPLPPKCWDHKRLPNLLGMYAVIWILRFPTVFWPAQNFHLAISLPLLCF